jgi:hypothetical protein
MLSISFNDSFKELEIGRSFFVELRSTKDQIIAGLCPAIFSLRSLPRGQYLYFVEAVGERTGSERSERLSPIYFNDSFKEFG